MPVNVWVKWEGDKMVSQTDIYLDVQKLISKRCFYDFTLNKMRLDLQLK